MYVYSRIKRKIYESVLFLYGLGYFNKFSEENYLEQKIYHTLAIVNFTLKKQLPYRQLFKMKK